MASVRATPRPPPARQPAARRADHHPGVMLDAHFGRTPNSDRCRPPHEFMPSPPPSAHTPNYSERLDDLSSRRRRSVSQMATVRPPEESRRHRQSPTTIVAPPAAKTLSCPQVPVSRHAQLDRQHHLAGCGARLSVDLIGITTTDHRVRHQRRLLSDLPSAQKFARCGLESRASPTVAGGARRTSWVIVTFGAAGAGLRPPCVDQQASSAATEEDLARQPAVVRRPSELGIDIWSILASGSTTIGGHGLQRIAAGWRDCGVKLEHTTLRGQRGSVAARSRPWCRPLTLAQQYGGGRAGTDDGGSTPCGGLPRSRPCRAVRGHPDLLSASTHPPKVR